MARTQVALVVLLTLAVCAMAAQPDSEALSRKLLQGKIRKVWVFPEAKCWALVDETRPHGCDHHGDWHDIACCDYVGKCTYDPKMYDEYEKKGVYCKPGQYAACCRMDHSGGVGH